ncbi:uncharacterized mitochondrial protein AtMg00310-like [Telopea speciosissima]|uniref:uncharacterized mitochondrial protein AtMg00310-like n=1 Tax=Telopea speciosissima TaxID=54955 RepID=UPI001CC3C640|nr:uncharacterized mitochondrial protein AtMg00310-like [Telopea speciosissima]
MGNYANSHFKLPASHHSQIRKEATSFFWGDDTDKRKIRWIAWRRLCRSKDLGGLGFRDPELQNKALLSKMAWRLWKEPDSMWGRFMKAIYFPNGDFLSARLGAQPSWPWRSLLEGRKVLKDGNGRRMSFPNTSTLVIVKLFEEFT